MSSEEIRYQHHEVTHNLNAPREVVRLICNLFSPKSVVDVGCGLGTWLKVFQEYRVNDILGLDGHNVDTGRLQIDPQYFRAVDLRKPVELNRRFDVVLSLEVAEHLDEKYADAFIDLLTSLGGTIIFSAAIPGQGGQNHLNEQWPDYWLTKFKQKGFQGYDLVRPQIWNNEKVDFWYKQNILVYSKEKIGNPVSTQYVNLVHPELLAVRNKEIATLYKKLNNPGFARSVKNVLKSLIR